MTGARRLPRAVTVALIALAALASRCASWKQEIESIPPLGAASRDQAWDELLRIRRTAPRLASYASIRVEANGSKQGLRATITTDGRGRLRVDAFSPIGTAAFTLYADGRETLMIDHGNRTWWRGPFPVAAASLGLPGSLDAHSIAMLVFGLPASAEPETERAERVVQDGVSYLVENGGIAEARGAEWIARFEPPSFPASSVTISTLDGARGVTVRHLESGAATRGVESPKIDPSYRCCVEPAAR